ncbi:unnamed protein product, partial [Effrenium voratum]
QALAEHGQGMAHHFEVMCVDRISLHPGAPGVNVKTRTHTINLKIRAHHLTSLIKVAKQFGVSESFGSIDVLEVRCTTEQPPQPPEPFTSSCWGRCQRRWQKFNSTALHRMSTLEIHTAIVANSFLSFNHLACIIIASGMAAIGLITDSSVFVLAAFFVSPLMQMILATVWGLTVQDMYLTTRGFWNMCFGALVCMVYGFLFGAVLGCFTSERDLITPVNEGRGSATSYISINTLQISSRGPPAGNILMSGIIAALSGVAIALGQGSGMATALIGVCISTSLLPPLVNAGMMWSLQLAFPLLRDKAGYTLSEIGLCSLYLYLVNIVCIIVFAWAAFKFKHIGGRTLRPMSQALVGVGVPETEINPAQIPELLRSFSNSYEQLMSPESNERFR